MSDSSIRHNKRRPIALHYTIALFLGAIATLSHAQQLDIQVEVTREKADRPLGEKRRWYYRLLYGWAQERVRHEALVLQDGWDDAPLFRVMAAVRPKAEDAVIVCSVGDRVLCLTAKRGHGVEEYDLFKLNNGPGDSIKSVDKVVLTNIEGGVRISMDITRSKGGYENIVFEGTGKKFNRTTKNSDLFPGIRRLRCGMGNHPF